jgi:hypothetical protein
LILKNTKRRQPDLRTPKDWLKRAKDSATQEEEFKQKGYRSKVNHKGKRNKPLSEFKKQVHKRRSQVRARVEHVFGHQATAMGGELMRCIGIVRAKSSDWATQFGLQHA